MDLSLRSYVGGWKAIFLEDTTCLNELPASFFAYRKQQHRWTCGPVQLWRKTGAYIWKSNLPLHRKVRLTSLPYATADPRFVMSAVSYTEGICMPRILMHALLCVLSRNGIVTVNLAYFAPKL